MKSRSNKSNKDEKQAFEAKAFIDIKILFTGNVLWPVFTETELQINLKKISKNDEAQKPKIFLKTIIFKIYNWLKVSTDSVELDCDTPDAKSACK